MRYREPYTLYPRTIGERVIWYYYQYDDRGNRKSRSTGIGFTSERDRKRTRREAAARVAELHAHSELGRAEGITLAAWIAARHFWDFRRSTYVRAILARSSREKPGITESYCRTAEQITRDHILPDHGEKPIEKITPYECEQILFRWQAQASNKTANNWKSVYSTILGEYERELKMRDPKADFFNPWRMVMPLAVDKNKYGALTISEVMRIVSPAAFDAKGAVYYLASKLAFLAGLRIAEVCGLYTEDVKDIEVSRGDTSARLSYLEVKYQWNQKVGGRTLVKDKEVRRIPVSAELRDEMDPLLAVGPGRFVFSFHPRQETPLTANRLREWLYRHMEAQGISAADRDARNITFHSARRFFNTLLRHEKVADSIIRRFTGHDSDEMTEHYTDYLPEDMQEISRAQSRLLLGEIRE